MSTEVPAVVLAGADGEVLSQNAPARRLLGAGRGKPCWKVVGALPGARGLPCQRSCVRDSLASGFEKARHSRFSLDGRSHHLTCVPLDGVMVCMIAPGSGSSPEHWQLLTARERDVLRLIARGGTTASIAEKLALSGSTVRTHIEHMFSKLGVQTRAALVFRAVRLGFLD